METFTKFAFAIALLAAVLLLHFPPFLLLLFPTAGVGCHGVQTCFRITIRFCFVSFTWALPSGNVRASMRQLFQSRVLCCSV